MTVISNELDTPLPSDSPDETPQRRSQKSPRRRRSMRRTIVRYMEGMLQSRHLFSVGLGLFLLAGFIHVSLINDVFDPDDETARWMASRFGADDGLPKFGVGLLKHTQVDPVMTEHYADIAATDPDQAISLTPLASAWLTGDFGTLEQLPARNEDVENTLTSRTSGEQLIAKATTAETTTAEITTAETLKARITTAGFTTAGTATAGIRTAETTVAEISTAENTAATERSDAGLATYVVNEGGSLWRTGRRFIDDEVLLDKLIDNLERSGMDVRRVRPGIAFTVNDLGSDGMIVTVDNGGQTYESLVREDQVTTLVKSEG